MKILRERLPVIRKCNRCWSELEVEMEDLIRHEDKVVPGHVYFTFTCPVCGNAGTGYWGLGGDYPMPGEWLDKLFPKT